MSLQSYIFSFIYKRTIYKKFLFDISISYSEIIQNRFVNLPARILKSRNKIAKKNSLHLLIISLNNSPLSLLSLQSNYLKFNFY